MWELAVGLSFYLLLGGLFPLRASSRRRAYHLRNSTALAGYLILGLDVFWLVVGTAILTTLCPYRLFHVETDTSVGRFRLQRLDNTREEVLSVFLDTSFLMVSLSAAHLYFAGGIDGGYPVPLDTTLDVVVFLSITFLASSLIALFSESYYRLATPVEPPAPPGGESKLLPRDAPLYGLLVVIGAPLQLLAHMIYLSYGPVPFLLGLIWFVLFVFLHSLLLKRRRQLVLLFHDLEVNQRLAALGEVTGRIVHQTRHQLGLIGISVHLIRDALGDGERVEAERIRKELDRLEGVAETLRRMLTGDLLDRKTSMGTDSVAPVTFMDLVRREVEFLKAKADKRGVNVIMGGNCSLVPAGDSREIQRLAQGVFNVLENAISAAQTEVTVHLQTTPTYLDIVISDDGPGMEDELLERAAQPFVTTKKDGTGMGLAIALAAARLWEGDLVLENRSGVGLKVVFQLPFRSRGE